MFNIEYNLEKKLSLANPDAKKRLDDFLNFFQKYVDDGIFTRGNIKFVGKEVTFSRDGNIKSKNGYYADIQFLVKINYNQDINKYYLSFLTELNYIVDLVGSELEIEQFSDGEHRYNKDIINSFHFKIK